MGEVALQQLRCTRPSSGRRVRGPTAEAFVSASKPSISRCPSSALGTSLPLKMNADPMPVPRVMTSTVPLTPFAGAVAGLGQAGGVGVVDDLHGAAQRVGEQRVDVRAEPATCPRWRPSGPRRGWMMAGKVTPTGRAGAGASSGGPRARSTICATTSATASGVDGLGVSNRNRSPTSLPFLRSTMPPLMPVPPMSMPISGAFLCDLLVLLGQCDSVRGRWRLGWATVA